MDYNKTMSESKGVDQFSVGVEPRDALIGNVVVLSVYRQCIDAGILVKPDYYDTFGYTISDISTFKEIVDHNQDAISNTLEDNHEDIEPFTYDNDIDPQTVVKEATQKVISIAHNSGLLDLATIRLAGKLAGVSNTKYLPDAENHTLLMRGEYEHLLSDVLEKRKSIQFKTAGHHRNEVFQLGIGGQLLADDYVDFARVARAIGIQLSGRPLMDFVLIRQGTAHEYGHAVDFGLLEAGHDTLELAQKIGYIKKEEVSMLGYALQNVHREHFARGFGNAIGNKYMESELGMTKDEIERFNQARDGSSELIKSSCYAFIDYAREKGYSVRALDDIAQAVNGAMKSNYVGKAIWFSNISRILAYLTPAYSEDEVRELIKRS